LTREGGREGSREGGCVKGKKVIYSPIFILLSLPPSLPSSFLKYFALHPSLLLDQPAERAVLDPFNIHALRGQLLSAADESLLGGR